MASAWQRTSSTRGRATGEPARWMITSCGLPTMRTTTPTPGQAGAAAARPTAARAIEVQSALFISEILDGFGQRRSEGGAGKKTPVTQVQGDQHQPHAEPMGHESNADV